MLLEAPSVPRQTLTPAFIRVLRGAMPEVSLRLLTVQSHHIGLPFRQEIAVLRGEPDAVDGCQALVKHPRQSRYSTGLLPFGE